jgi:hypothetical protein
LENEALTAEVPGDPKAPHWTPVDDWDNGATSKSLVDVDLNDACAGVHGAVTAVQSTARTRLRVGSCGDSPGDPGDDVLIVGPPATIVS